MQVKILQIKVLYALFMRPLKIIAPRGSPLDWPGSLHPLLTGIFSPGFKEYANFFLKVIVVNHEIKWLSRALRDQKEIGKWKTRLTHSVGGICITLWAIVG
jgi:hypothetical protein